MFLSMAFERFHSSSFLTVVGCLASLITAFTCCTFNGYDMSTLKGVWPVRTPERPGVRYEISLCDPLDYSTSHQNENCTDSVVCMFTESTTRCLGEYSNKSTDYATLNDNVGSGFSLFLTSSVCKKMELAASVISFACGPHLGSPELLAFGDCNAHFFWQTSAACKSPPKHNEVPCYTFDASGNKIDLTNLIKQSGGHTVSTEDSSVDLIINVCSDIIPDESVSGCPGNSSACIQTNGVSTSIGALRDRLEMVGDHAVLTYSADDSKTCSLTTTSIFFKCMGRLRSQPPRLISYNSCTYYIVWETEYACPERMLTGDLKRCRFTQENNGVDIDLSPLRKRESYYEVDGIVGSHSVKFFLNVCGGISNITCGGTSWKSISACQFDSKENSTSIIGTKVHSELRFADGRIFLTYGRGKNCTTVSGMLETTVINFICSKNETIGEPKHLSTKNCVNLFEWKTVHACLKKELGISCTAKEGEKVIHLEQLTKTEGEPWDVFEVGSRKYDKAARYLLNVCGDVSILNNASDCEPGAALCMIDSTGKYVNLGSFMSEPVYDSATDTTLLLYTNGSQCNNSNKQWISSIRFKCKPGHLKGVPVLVHVDENDCLYEFEWHTAEACPIGNLKGSSCKIFDPALDIYFDLNSLKSDVYTVESDSLKMYLTICGASSETPCTKDKSINSSDTGLCQVDKSDNKTVAVAKASDELVYMNGYVNMTLVNVDTLGSNDTQNPTIVFICDYGAGKGKPQLADKQTSSYTFYWYTSFVCLQSASTECFVHDPVTHQTYDLSSLSQADQNWVTFYDEDEKAKKAYINICRPLVPVENCDSSAAACIVDIDGEKEKAFFPNAGRAINRPELSSEGHLLLNYSSGSQCVAFGETISHTTMISFMCSKQIYHQEGLRYLGRVGACHHMFLWLTAAACPTGEIVVKNDCKLTDPNSGFRFDLTSLKKESTPYSVTIESKQYQLNICGPVKGGCLGVDGKADGGVAACEADKDGKNMETLAKMDDYSLSYSDETDLMLTYKNGSEGVLGTVSEVVIKFSCSASEMSPELKFLRKESNRYIFEMLTNLTCHLGVFDCNFVDSKGNEYDLSPLSKDVTEGWRANDTEWVVSDSRHGYSHLKYRISFCKPLSPSSEYNCPGGDAAACQVDMQSSTRQGQNLGTQVSSPTVAEDGTIVLQYGNGSYCRNGQFRRSTQVTLFCSSKQGNMVFIGETPECQYMFSLDTPAACPVQVHRGTDCKVVDPNFGFTYDLTPLKKSTVIATSGEYQYAIRVCDRLTDVPKKCSEAAVCQTKPSDATFARSLGLPTSDLMYHDGLITLKYEFGSGNCHGRYNRSSIIAFTCDYNGDNSSSLFFMSEAEDCSYFFEWPTKYACPPTNVIECVAQDEKGYSYDLTPLSLTNNNYYVKNSMNPNQTFVINVCRNVIPGPESMCPYTASSCLLDSGTSDPVKRSVSLGRSIRGPYFGHQGLRLKYSSGELCGIEGASTLFMETIIDFVCDEKAVDSEPEYVGRDECTYHFDWATVYACHVSESNSSSNCTVTDPFTGFFYDMSSLKSDKPYVVETGNHRFKLNVCGEVKGSSCGNQSGVCQEEIHGKRYWNGGKSSQDLQWNAGLLFLNYSDGAPCHQGRFERNTIIQFHCGSEIGKPEFLYETEDCTYYFVWNTVLACQSLVHCAIKNGTDHFSLAPLSSSIFMVHTTEKTGDVSEKTTYYIKVCGALGVLSGIPCPPSSSVCRVVGSGAISENLGKVEFPPFVDFTGHATAIYTSGSICANNRTNRARIIFLCDPEELQGNPVLISRNVVDCLYIFEWRTSVVCKEKPTILPEPQSCMYRDVGRSIYFDLSTLRKVNSSYEVKKSDLKGSFFVNVCGNVSSAKLPNCEGSAVCYSYDTVTVNHGLASTQKFSYDGKRLRLTVSSGDHCISGEGGKRSSEIFFICNPSAGLGSPFLYKNLSCLVVFMWETDLVCRNFQHLCSYDIDGHTYDLHLLSSLTHNWNLTDDKGNIYWVNPCRGIQQNSETSGCPPSSAVCMKNTSGTHMPLGMVYTSEVTKTNSTTLTLSYSTQSSLACTSTKSSMKAATKILFICGTHLGSPKFLSGPDTNCEYSFVWKTSTVCANRSIEVLPEVEGVLWDNDRSMDIKAILNSSFVVEGTSGSDSYTYLINLDGVQHDPAGKADPCSDAAVCQVKSNSSFKRDIGSIGTRAFFLEGNELFLKVTSEQKACGKNKERKVRTIFSMQCSVGVGEIEFLYESGGCDYLFSWDTYVVCPEFFRPHTELNTTGGTIFVDAHTQTSAESSHKTSIIVAFVFLAIIACCIIFVLSKAERRAAAASKLRLCFNRVTLPRFRYKRGDVLTELQSDF